MSKRMRGRVFWILLTSLPLTTAIVGCSFSEALLDGFFGGISDTVATVVTEAALGAASGDVQ